VTGPSARAELLERIERERRQLDRYIFYFARDAGGTFVPDTLKLSREEMTRPGVVGEWSVKQLLAHLISWEQTVLAWYTAGLPGPLLLAISPRVVSDEDETSLSISGAYRRRSLDRILAEWPASHRRFVEAVGGMAPKDLFTVGRFGWTGKWSLADWFAAVGARYRWAKEHIRGWSKTHPSERLTKSTLLAAIQSERRKLENTLELLSRQDMLTRGVCGEWSVKDVLVHLFAWEQLFAGWYKAGQRGEIPATPARGFTWRDLDKLNRQILQQHRRRKVDDVLAESHDSYRRTLAIVQAIPEDDLFQAGRYAWLGQGNLVGCIKANTSNHYRWARTLIRKWIKVSGKA
jgi:hypothetical protein